MPSWNGLMSESCVDGDRRCDQDPEKVYEPMDQALLGRSESCRNLNERVA